MSALQQWDAAVRAWRKMLADRPLGMFYQYPDPPLPPELGPCGSGWTARKEDTIMEDEITMGPEERELRNCSCGGAWVQEPCDPTCISWEAVYASREGE